MMLPRSSSPSPQIRATATTTTTTTAKRQIWSTVSMSMHHRTSTTTTTAGTTHEGELEVSPVFSRASKPASQAAAGSNSLPIPTTTTSTSSCKSSSSGLLPPPYSATQLPLLPSPSSSPKPEEQQTKSSSWRFEIALEGGSCVIKQLGPSMAPPPAEHQPGGATGILACVKALFSIVAGTVMAFVGVIVSLVAVLVTYIFPSMAAKAPESVARSSSINSRKRKLSPAPGSSSTSSPSIKDRRVLSPSDLSLVGSTSTGGGAAPAPGIQRHVTFNLERTRSSAAASVSSAGRSSHVDVVGLNTPTVATFAPTDDDEEKDVSEIGVVARAATISSSVPASGTSSSGKKRKSWFMKRRSATLATAGAGSDVDDSTSDAGTMTNSAPPTPSTLVTELPPVSEEEAGSASDAKGKKEAKRGRGISLKLQFNSKSWKRRSGGSSAAFVEAPATGAEEDGNSESVGVVGAEVTTPSSAASSNSVPIPPPTSKQQKRRSFPFVGSSSSSTPSSLSHQQQPPSTAPIRPTARTNPYGAPYFAAPPTARLTSKSTERRRGSYDDATAGAQSDRESAAGHRRAESADASGKMPPPIRQDSTGSGFSRASSSLASGTTGSESGLGLEGGAVTEMGEFVQPATATATPTPTPTPASPPPAAAAATKKTTSPYAKPRLPSTFPVSPLASTSAATSASGRVASDSTALQAQKNSNDSRKRTSSASNRPPVVDRHARMRDAALAWASDSEAASARVGGRKRSGSASAGVRGESRLRE